ncbi:sugar MFS transporter [Granulicella tundricola]|uniref:Glucose/galactose transporter n=1 Tax=Granulicella tundricola (strain ATCC BAA-1859 / DSM 23138 / MP5ACTX9) TaxID=1198114 RepID=E8X2J9_GRATM|nr:sugar MFS transporter [Granulicella tundricola]ADW69223.1 glucose/galactose transporter [Granulicella tundricola MP5ACTX9]
MAAATSLQTGSQTTNTQGSFAVPLTLMVSLYFGIGFITALNDILVPHFKDLFHLSNFLALLVQFAFFGAYFLMSVPSGWIVGRVGYKNGIVLSLATMGCGLLLFLPASILVFYPLFLFALFVVGSGLALLQVAINPYIGALGRPETAAARLNIAGFFNSLAGTSAPKVGAAFIFIAAGASAAQLAASVRTPYMILAALAFFMAILTRFVPLPRLLEPTAEAAAEPLDGSAWQFRHLRLGAVAIFLYVGAEVAIGSLLINYLGQPSMGSMTHAAAARYVSFYWGGAMIGRFIGSFALQKIDAAKALTFVAILAFITVATAVLAHGMVGSMAIVVCGLFNSVMWPCIFPLSVKGLGRFTSQGSGILIMMVVGGAVIPEIQGLLADSFGYQKSFLIVLCCYAYLIYFGLSGHRPQQSVETASQTTIAPPELV